MCMLLYSTIYRGLRANEWQFACVLYVYVHKHLNVFFKQPSYLGTRTDNLFVLDV